MSDLRCTCGNVLPPSFPGARVTCACGAAVDIPGPDPAAERASTPYRAASAVVAAEPLAACPFCGHESPALARVCPTCDVRLESARCRRCFALGAPGAYTCSGCGAALPRDVLFDPNDAPCPRCATPLETARGEADPVHECPRCGGIFASISVLPRILVEAENGRLPLTRGGKVPVANEAHYVPCPMCHARMNRTGFAKTGVIVDVCARHGTWFDPGELTRALGLVAQRRRVL